MKNAQNDQNIEVEFRSLLDEEQFLNLRSFLAENARDLGEDNKHSHFFIFSDKLLKVTDNITKNNAKITLKLQKIGLGSDFEEIEVFFPREDANKVVRIFDILGFKNYMYSFQNRHNYLYNDVEISLKYTVSWGFHCELEIMVAEKQEVISATQKIHQLASALGIKIMTDEELREFTQKIESGWVRGQYSEKEFEIRNF